MDYKPKFSYTSRKNNEMETQEGFKGFVLNSGQYLIYFSVHILQSSIRRVTARFHTISFVVVDRNTKKVLMEIQHKGDFGFTGVQLINRSFYPINLEQRGIQAELESGPDNFRSINIMENNGLFEQSRGKSLGQYEFWRTLPICMKARNRREGVNIVLKTPNTGIRSMARQGEKVLLGRLLHGKMHQSKGLNRELRFKNLQFGAEFCPSSGAKGGYFYTDPTGHQIRPGPGPTSVRQYVEPGFKASLTGKFEIEDPWGGLHRDQARGFFTDHGFGIDPEQN